VTRKYAGAIGIFITALGLRLALDLALPRSQFVTFYPAVILTAYLCGLGPAALTLGLCITTALLRMMYGDVNIVSIVGFAVGGTICLLIVRQLQQANERLVEKRKQLELINREMRHRVRNALSIGPAIISQVLSNPRITREEADRIVYARMQAIAKAQDLLGTHEFEPIKLMELAKSCVEPMAHGKNYAANGDDITVKREYVTPLAMVLHELATNATKHGAWRNGGAVWLSWSVRNEKITIDWIESVRLTAAARARPPGTGLRMIRKAIPNAQVEHVIDETGVRCSIKI
jgi:two-component sensor histidine kinase